MLSKIQNELKVPKTEFNSFGKYHYRTAEGILEAVKPLLAKDSCYITLDDEIVCIGNRNYVKATVKLFSEKGIIAAATGYAREEETKKGMDAAQITGAASSYARKYALNGLFALSDGGEDVDNKIDHDLPDNSSSNITLDDKPAMATTEQWSRFSTIIQITGIKEKIDAVPDVQAKCKFAFANKDKVTKIMMDELLEKLDEVCLPL